MAKYWKPRPPEGAPRVGGGGGSGQPGQPTGYAPLGPDWLLPRQPRRVPPAWPSGPAGPKGPVFYNGPITNMIDVLRSVGYQRMQDDRGGDPIKFADPSNGFFWRNPNEQGKRGEYYEAKGGQMWNMQNFLSQNMAKLSPEAKKFIFQKYVMGGDMERVQIAKLLGMALPK